MALAQLLAHSPYASVTLDAERVLDRGGPAIEVTPPEAAWLVFRFGTDVVIEGADDAVSAGQAAAAARVIALPDSVKAQAPAAPGSPDLTKVDG